MTWPQTPYRPPHKKCIHGRLIGSDKSPEGLPEAYKLWYDNVFLKNLNIYNISNLRPYLSIIYVFREDLKPKLFFRVYFTKNSLILKEENRRWNFMERNWLDVVCLILIIIGAINWGLVGFFNLDLISVIFGNMSMISRIIFAVVGIPGIYSLVLFWKLKSE